jgi:hypothetical protein
MPLSSLSIIKLKLYLSFRSGNWGYTFHCNSANCKTAQS